MNNETIHSRTTGEVATETKAPREFAGEGGSQATGEVAAVFAAEHYDEVFRYCARRLPAKEDAQDATQEVFLRLVRSKALYERRGKPLAYLYTCARNVCAEFYRRTPTPREPIDGMEERLADPTHEHDEARLEMSDAIGRLSAVEQKVLELRYGQGLSMNEISAVTGRSRFAVRRIEKRALAALEALIGDRP